MVDDTYAAETTIDPWTRAEDGSTLGRWELPLATHPRLELASDFAQIRVVPTAPGTAPYLEVESSAGAAPKVDVRVEGGVTRVRVGLWRALEEKLLGGRFWEASFWEKRNWQGAGVRVTLHAPTDLHARLRSAAARVQVEGLRDCDLEIETEAGALSLEDVSGRLRLRTEAGRIDGRGLAGSLDVATSAGAVQLEVTALHPGTHRIRTNMGAVKIELAEGIPVRIDARTTMGATRVDFPSSKEARAVLDVEADLGAVRVTRSSRAWTPPRSPTPSAPPITDATSPYRSAAAVNPGADDAEVQRVLERVADGSLSPSDARDLLRAMGAV